MAKDYLINNENLMKEWNWEKNNSLGLFPDKITLGSNKKYGGCVMFVIMNG